jgi:soluble lytic murein transglycosylase-like protein
MLCQITTYASLQLAREVGVFSQQFLRSGRTDGDDSKRSSRFGTILALASGQGGMMTLRNDLSVQTLSSRSALGLQAGRSVKPAAPELFSQIYAHWVSRQSDASNDCAVGLKAPDYRANPVCSRFAFSFRNPDCKLGSQKNPQNGTSPSASAEQTSARDNSGEELEKASIQAAVERAARTYNLPAKLINAIIRAESNFEVSAVSPAGAQGLMQLMPSTAEELGVTNPFDIDQNIDGGARYLREMLNRFDGNLQSALAAYNAGPSAVAKYAGEVPYPETKRYVSHVLQLAGQSV